MKHFQTSFLTFLSLPLALTLACGQIPKAEDKAPDTAPTNTDAGRNSANDAGTTPSTAPNTTPKNETNSDSNPDVIVPRLPGTINPTPVSRNVIRQAKGLQAADIQKAVDQFRADLGGANNLGAVGTQIQGHREINWDGVPADKSAPNLFPGDFFKARGALFSSPCDQLQVSAKAQETIEVLFSNINPSFSQIFRAFSPEKLFAALGSRIIDVTFTVPGSDEPASVQGFGSVFTDVDLQGSTTMEFYDVFGSKIMTVPVPAVPHTDGSQSFVGVKFNDGQEISKVRIIMGNVALNNFVSERNGKDAVAADDFLYAEPKSLPRRL